MAEYFGSFVFMPDLETILATTSNMYRHFENLIDITECSEIFKKNEKNENSRVQLSQDINATIHSSF